MSKPTEDAPGAITFKEHLDRTELEEARDGTAPHKELTHVPARWRRALREAQTQDAQSQMAPDAPCPSCGQSEPHEQGSPCCPTCGRPLK